MEARRHKQILDKLKKSNQIFEVDYDTLEKDLEVSLEQDIIQKQDILSSLLLEKELLKLKISLTP
ncbi:hypothetical protein [Aquimarina aggregata]|uniref:hypothetical protein n=1 Tax=Aquimarina aggregata TaxID=1642818 RepID=UPI002490C269|nr:hypothetical protein [Aquimarina aggregata]